MAHPHPTQQHHQHQHHRELPSISSLTNGLPPPIQQRSPDQHSLTDSTRDSGTWPQPHSKHTSANSGLHVSTLLNPDESPNRNSIPSTPLSARMPNSAHSGSNILPSINQGFQEPGNRDSHASMDSRRSSVDSRMHQTFNGLYINNPTSPYESANNSQVSLAASLRRPNGGPMSPMGARSGIRTQPRVAPPIMPIGRKPGQPDPTAANPTQGFAWAFPDEIPEERRSSESGSSLNDRGSRTNSFATSVRSSIFSNDSRLPNGQRRFDDEHATTHHHTMQHPTIQSLQNENMSSSAVGNYSRTPELRVSHKLAERKRRSEMKDLFEDLNKAVPASGGAKASKWEILTKAIDYIRNQQQLEHRLQQEVSRLGREADYSREAQKENEMLRTEIQVMHQHLRRLEPNNTHIYGQFTSQLNAAQGQGQGQQPPPPQSNGNSGISLPPINPPGPANGPSGFGGTGQGAMQGVEYGYGAR